MGRNDVIAVASCIEALVREATSTRAHQDHLPLVVGVADHGREVVGKYARHLREAADVAIDDAE